MKAKVFRALALLVIGVVLGISGVAFAVSSYKTQFNTRYGTAGPAIDQCLLCHTSNSNPSAVNPYGTAYANSGYDFAAIEPYKSLLPKEEKI